MSRSSNHSTETKTIKKNASEKSKETHKKHEMMKKTNDFLNTHQGKITGEDEIAIPRKQKQKKEQETVHSNRRNEMGAREYVQHKEETARNATRMKRERERRKGKYERETCRSLCLVQSNGVGAR